MGDYSDLDGNHLMGLFGSDSWKSMSFEQRLSACQEVENRYAAANGVAPCRVMTEPMIGGTYGWQSGNTITLNESLLRDGCFLTEDVDENGNKVIVPLADHAPGWNILDTIFHEGTHGIQTEQGRMVDTYIQPESDRDLYRIQGIEKEAFAAGQQNTLTAIQLVQQSTGKIDPQAKAYLTSVQEDRFETALDDAKQRYQDPYIEYTLAQVIQDRENGVQQTSPWPSYTKVSELLDAQDRAIMQQAAQGNTVSVSAGSQAVAEKQSGMQDDGVLIPSAGAETAQVMEDDGVQLDNNVEAGQSFDDGVSLEDSAAEPDNGSENDYEL